MLNSFSYSRTAFDIDLESEAKKPWRERGVDLADYFNYGFDEDAWRSYCEKQLKHRADLGLGPPTSRNLMNETNNSSNISMGEVFLNQIDMGMDMDMAENKS